MNRKAIVFGVAALAAIIAIPTMVLPAMRKHEAKACPGTLGNGHTGHAGTGLDPSAIEIGVRRWTRIESAGSADSLGSV